MGWEEERTREGGGGGGGVDVVGGNWGCGQTIHS